MLYWTSILLSHDNKVFVFKCIDSYLFIKFLMKKWHAINFLCIPCRDFPQLHFSFRHCWSVHIRHDTDILPQSTCREGVMLVYNRNPDFIITLTWKIKKCIITQAFQINTVKQNVTYSKIVYMNQHTTTNHYISNY